MAHLGTSDVQQCRISVPLEDGLAHTLESGFHVHKRKAVPFRAKKLHLRLPAPAQGGSFRVTLWLLLLVVVLTFHDEP